MPDVGVSGFRKISEAAILVVGAGGLGSPAALYLAGAGVGCLGLVDGDNVEITNMHRQVMHSEDRIGMNKAASGALACQALNSSITIRTHSEFLDEGNAMGIISQYDVILDATDNVVTRYLLNDACVLLRKPLVSGSALRMEGQLTVYSYCGGPCYRCIFPTPPPVDSVTNCADGGVVGPVPGVVGTLQVIVKAQGMQVWFEHMLRTLQACQHSAHLDPSGPANRDRQWRPSRLRWARRRRRCSWGACCSMTRAPAASEPSSCAAAAPTATSAATSRASRPCCQSQASRTTVARRRAGRICTQTCRRSPRPTACRAGTTAVSSGWRRRRAPRSGACRAWKPEGG